MTERTLTAPPAAPAAIASRPAAAPKTIHRVPPRPGAPLRLSAKTIKVTLVVDGAVLVPATRQIDWAQIKSQAPDNLRNFLGQRNSAAGGAVKDRGAFDARLDPPFAVIVPVTVWQQAQASGCADL